MTETLPRHQAAIEGTAESKQLPDEAPALHVQIPRSSPEQRVTVAGEQDDGGTARAPDPIAVARALAGVTASELSGARFIARMEWQGLIESVAEDHFVATLTTREKPEDRERAEIWLEEVSPRDRDRVRPGALFYWVIGHREEPHGQRFNESVLRFRRTWPLSDEERRLADTRAAERFRWATGTATGPDPQP
jgi:hypothetical protein